MLKNLHKFAVLNRYFVYCWFCHDYSYFGRTIKVQHYTLNLILIS